MTGDKQFSRRGLLRYSLAGAAAVGGVAVLGACSTTDEGTDTSTREDLALDHALRHLVEMSGGPPGAIALVQRGRAAKVHSFGVAETGTTRRPRPTDHMHIASTAKAFSGAVALALVDRGILALEGTVGDYCPDLPANWHPVTLRQLLQHTSGVPEFLNEPAAQKAIGDSLGTAPAPRQLLDFVAHRETVFAPGSSYEYSNSDNIVVGLFVEAAAGRSYENALRRTVLQPLALRATSLRTGPELPTPRLHGYDTQDSGGPPEDVSEVLAGGWSWAAGGIVSTPQDLNRFIRGYVGGELFGADVQAQQARFVRGSSEPPGPGTNAAGLALFRYVTDAGTVYGHTGNTLGYTQFAAASRDGDSSCVVTINAQRTQNSEGTAAQVFTALRDVERLAVAAALHDREH